MGLESKFIITQFTRFSRQGFLPSRLNLSVLLQSLYFNQDILTIMNSRKAHIFIIDNTFLSKMSHKPSLPDLVCLPRPVSQIDSLVSSYGVCICGRNGGMHVLMCGRYTCVPVCMGCRG